MVRQSHPLVAGMPEPSSLPPVLSCAGFRPCFVPRPILPATTTPTAMTYAQDKQFLGQHTKVIELDGAGRGWPSVPNTRAAL